MTKDHRHRRPPKRCEEFAKRGTGYGVCDAPLDQHGRCPRAGDHRDSRTMRELRTAPDG